MGEKPLALNFFLLLRDRSFSSAFQYGSVVLSVRMPSLTQSWSLDRTLLVASRVDGAGRKDVYVRAGAHIHIFENRLLIPMEIK
jgi:hypothetical protein